MVRHINYPERQAAFIGQVAVETGNLKTLTQGAPFGSTKGGTSVGRGYLQITGTANYRAASAFLGKPLSDTQRLLATNPGVGAIVSGWYWDGGTGVRDINRFADSWDITAVSQLINAGRTNPRVGKGPNKGRPVKVNGLAERLSASQTALDVIYATFDT